MSRYNWYDLVKNGDIIGYGGSLGMSDFLNDELFMNYVTISLNKINEETTLDIFEIVWTHHESGFNNGGKPKSIGLGEAHFSSLPPIIRNNIIVFQDVIFKKEIK